MTMNTQTTEELAASIASTIWATGGAPEFLTEENVAETLRLRRELGREDPPADPTSLIPLITEAWWTIARAKDE